MGVREARRCLLGRATGGRNVLVVDDGKEPGNQYQSAIHQALERRLADHLRSCSRGAVSEFCRLQGRHPRQLAGTYAGGVLRYTASNGTAFTFFDNATTPRVNGTPIDYAPAAVFNSPHMQSVWNSGRITITQGGLRARPTTSAIPQIR